MYSLQSLLTWQKTFSVPMNKVYTMGIWAFSLIYNHCNNHPWASSRPTVFLWGPLAFPIHRSLTQFPLLTGSPCCHPHVTPDQLGPGQWHRAKHCELSLATNTYPGGEADRHRMTEHCVCQPDMHTHAHTHHAHSAHRWIHVSNTGDWWEGKVGPSHQRQYTGLVNNVDKDRWCVPLAWVTDMLRNVNDIVDIVAGLSQTPSSHGRGKAWKSELGF